MSLLVKSRNDESRRGFRLRAVDRVEIWCLTGFSDSGKSIPLIVLVTDPVIIDPVSADGVPERFRGCCVFQQVAMVSGLILWIVV